MTRPWGCKMSRVRGLVRLEEVTRLGDAVAPVGTRSRAIRRSTSNDGDASRFARFSRSKAGRLAYIAGARMLKHRKESGETYCAGRAGAHPYRCQSGSARSFLPCIPTI